ncbi:UNVERIFIED_CONTAM: hypothetical protein GTU68_014198 [Idotea baltica]|nr:hypothetical protein [Idotea baltica]
MPTIPTLESKLPNVGTTIFTLMTNLANEHKAINLSQGFPAFDPPQKLIDGVKYHLNQNAHQYAPMIGAQSLREALANKIELLYQNKLDPNTTITITAGATQALYTAITALVHKQDEVIVIDPAYDVYAPSIALCGAKAVHISCVAPTFEVPWDQIDAACNEKTSCIIINTPQNPSTKVFSQADIKALEKIVLKHNLFIISDEVYEHLIYDDYRHESILKNPILFERAFVCYSFGKLFNNTGWKIGYCVAPPNLSIEFRKVHQFNVFSVNHPMQLALADFISNPGSYYLELSRFYQKKKDAFESAIRKSRFKIIPSHASYFQLLDYSAISDQVDIEFAKKLILENGIASIPISVFYKDAPNDRILRFCFAKEESTLLKAAKILCQI